MSRMLRGNFQSGGGNNGIENAALGSSKRKSRSRLTLRTLQTEQYSFQSMIPNVPSPFHFQDLRQGEENNFFHNWSASNFGTQIGNQVPASYTSCLQDGIPVGGNQQFYIPICTLTKMYSYMPGWSLGNPAYGPQGWLVHNAGFQTIADHSAGITEAGASVTYKLGIGDNISYYHYTNGEGGVVATSDEGTKGMGNLVQEDTWKFDATCSTGCTAGSKAIKVTNTTLAATGTCNGEIDQVGADCSMGVGRYLIDTTQGGTSTTVSAFASGLGTATAVTVAATVPVSNAWGTSGNCGPASGSDNVVAPPFSKSYTCTITLTSGTFNTSAPVCFGSQFHEQSIPTAVGSASSTQTITLPLRKGHASGGYVFQGGMCGTGMELSAYNQNGGRGTLRYLFDVLGSTDAHTIQTQVWLVGLGKPITTFLSLNIFDLNGNSQSLHPDQQRINGKRCLCRWFDLHPI